jgi:hypothetical protein
MSPSRNLRRTIALTVLLFAGCGPRGSNNDDKGGAAAPAPPATVTPIAPPPTTPAPPANGAANPASGTGGASQTPSGSMTTGGGSAIAARWSFPALIPDGKGGFVFPTYLAHLLGTSLDHPFPTDLACADVTNPGPQTSASLTVGLAVYGEDAAQDVTLPTGSWHVCLTPAFDAGKLHALTSETAGRVEVSLSVGGAVVSEATQEVSIAPVDEIAWDDGAIAVSDMKELAAVFVTPDDPTVDQLQRLAVEASAFGGFGDGDAYARHPYARTTDIPAGSYAGEDVIIEAGESIAWQVSNVSGGDTGTIDVYLFTPDQLTAWSNGTSQDATAAWAAQTSGAWSTFSPPEGRYELIFFNTGSEAPETVTWTRNPTREDVAEDSLQSIYAALQSLKTKYSDISGSYFAGFQHVRRASEVLGTLSANCLDGSLLFASTLELVGMEPVVIFKTGHAYVGVRSAPGSDVVWPVETTMVGTNPFADAFSEGLDELVADSASDPQFQLLDVKAMRTRGVLPLPQ